MILFLPAYALGQHLQITTLSPKVSATAGDTKTILIKISNQSSQSVHLSTSVLLPETWSLINGRDQIKIQPNTSKIEPVTIYVPKGTPPGQNTINYKASLEGRNKIIRAVFSVEISQNSVIEMSAVSTLPKFVFEGDTITQRYRIQNKGNVNSQVYFRLDSLSSADAKKIKLPPNTQKEVSIQTVFNKSLSAFREEILEVQLLEQKSDSLLLKETKTVEVYAVNVVPKKNKQTIPLQFSSYYLGQKNREVYRDNWWNELHLRGNLNKHHIDAYGKFLTYNTDPINRNFNSFRFAYQNPKLKLFLGDRSFRGSVLTQNARMARGGALEWKQNQWRIEGYYYQPLFFEAEQHVGGVHFNYSNHLQRLNLGYLYKTDANNNPVHLSFVGIQSRILKNLELEGEISASKDTENMGYGYFAKLFWKHPRVYVLASTLSTNKDFRGYFQNTSYKLVSIRAKLTDRIDAGVRFLEDYQKRQLDTIYRQSPYTKTRFAYLKAEIWKQFFLKMGYENRLREDRNEDKKFWYEEQNLYTELEKKWNNIVLESQFRIGRTENFINNNREEFWEWNMFGSADFGKINAVAYMNYQNSIRYNSAQTELFVVGANFKHKLSPSTNWSIGVQNNFNIEESYRDRSNFNLQLQQKFLKHHSLRLGVNYGYMYHLDDQQYWTLQFHYALQVPLQLKMSKKRSKLEGKVLFNGVSNKPIRLQLGQHKTICNANGYFSFSQLLPGKYLLYVHPEDLQNGLVTDLDLPKEIEIDAPVQEVSFTVSKAVSISGKFVQDLSGGKFKEEDKSQQILLKLTQGDKQYYHYGAITASFSFHNLNPGIWNLSAAMAEDRSSLQLLKTKFVIDTKAGEHVNISIPLAKKKRKIKFLQKNN